MTEPTPIRAGVPAPWPDPVDEAAYHGLAGEIVRALDPHTEADPVGVLVSLLAGFGNALGPRPHLLLDSATHGLRVWPVLVGPTGSGRKGTALAVAGSVLGRAASDWWERRSGGLSTGEGVIWDVRDPVSERREQRAKGGQLLGYETVVTDTGSEEKRRLFVETEFGSVLQVLGRERNTLSAVLRNAWDGLPLATITKGSQTRATGAHITITGHVTPEEVRELLGAREAANGFANRFLWVCVRRSKLLPLGEPPDEGTLVGLSEVLRVTLEDAAKLGRLTLDEAATAAYVRVYGALDGDEPGVVGQLLSRAAPTIMRLAGIYAALDVAERIGVAHLEAALALWGYAEASVRHIFGPPVVATRAHPYRGTILAGLAAGGLTQTEITRDLFGGNLRAPEPYATLEALLAEGLIARAVERPPSGRGPNVTRWTITATGRAEAGR